MESTIGWGRVTERRVCSLVLKKKTSSHGKTIRDKRRCEPKGKDNQAILKDISETLVHPFQTKTTPQHPPPSPSDPS